MIISMLEVDSVSASSSRFQLLGWDAAPGEVLVSIHVVQAYYWEPSVRTVPVSLRLRLDGGRVLAHATERLAGSPA